MGYTKLNIASNRTAMEQLGYSAYMLYMYFCINATGFNLILSKVALCSETKLSANTYYAAFNELVEKGYLVRKPGTQCLYNFYEDPARAGAIPKNRTTRIEKQESRPQKAVENIKNTFQLTDDVAIGTPDELGSLKIARARHIMHLADNMIMFMHLNSWQKKLYALQNEERDEAWGEGAWMILPDDKNIAAFRLVKNRRGGGKEKIFAVQTNLDYNRWEPIGELIRNEKQSKAG